MFVVFVAHLARPAQAEASVLAPALGVSEYEARLALALPAPAIVMMTEERERANEVAAAVRARGHGVHVFDDAAFVPSARMTRMDDFRLDADGVRRVADGELLPYGDVFAILRAMHESSEHVDRGAVMASGGRVVPRTTRHERRENVAYFFRRSGAAPWLLREQHTSYGGLGAERAPVAFTNFVRTMQRVREASTSAVADDRLLRRRVPERLSRDPGDASSRDGMDLLAHLLAMTLASLSGSPYR